jgi:polysaccharide transporter, PST family
MIRERIKKFTKTDLFKTSIWNGIATVLKLMISIVTNKIVAIFLGPGGIALLGQFGNFVSMVTSFSSLGVNTGVTKYISEFKDDYEQRNKFLSTSFYITVIGTLIASLVVYFGRNYFSDFVFHTHKYVSIIVVLAITLILFTLNAFFIAVFNGFKQFKIIIARNILGSLISLAMAVLLVIRYGLYGALLGVIFSQTLVFFVLLGAILKAKWFSREELFLRYFDLKTILKLSNFTLMTLVSTFFSNYIQLRIRNYVIVNVSVTDAGYWEALTRISGIYLMVITSTMSLYYLPRLSEIKENIELRAEIIKGYKFLLPLTIFACLGIFIFKRLIVNILFTSAFLPMLPLFRFQLIGDILRISSWLLAYNFLAKAMTKIYIISEIVFGISLYFSTIFCVHRFGIIGVTYAYAFVYFCYMISMYFIFRRTIFKKQLI